MLGMALQRIADNVAHLENRLVRDPVIRRIALLPPRHQPRILEQPHVLAHVWLASSRRSDDFHHAHLTPIQGVQDLQTHRIR